MTSPSPGDVLCESFDSERLKTLSVWSEFGDGDLTFRPATYARTPHEHMVHQCVSEDTWMRTMLAIHVPLAALPVTETRLGFLEHYAAVSQLRLEQLVRQSAAWWHETTQFFDVERTHAWVMLRRLTHTAHHRGQLTTLLRLLGTPLYSTYGPTADTGGLFLRAAPTQYRYGSIDELLVEEGQGGRWPPLPGPGEHPPTERP